MKTKSQLHTKLDRLRCFRKISNVSIVVSLVLALLTLVLGFKLAALGMFLFAVTFLNATCHISEDIDETEWAIHLENTYNPDGD